MIYQDPNKLSISNGNNGYQKRQIIFFIKQIDKFPTNGLDNHSTKKELKEYLMKKLRKYKCEKK